MTAEDVLDMHDAQSLDLAVIMRRPPDEIDRMGYLDSLSFLSTWTKTERAAASFQAAIHGRSLK